MNLVSVGKGEPSFIITIVGAGLLLLCKQSIVILSPAGDESVGGCCDEKVRSKTVKGE